MPTQTEPAAPWWARNRDKEPFSLLFEANQMDVVARMRRRDANRLREQAKACDESANMMERAARDYRQWAKERSIESADPN
jgi:hypothetical protein